MHTTKRRAVGVLLALFAILGLTFVSTGSASASDLKFQVVHNAGTSASPATIEDGCYTKDWSDGYHLGFCVWLSYNNDYSSDVSADISDTAWAEKVHVYCQRNGVYVGCRGITFDSHIRHGYNSDGTNRYYEGYNYSCGVFPTGRQHLRNSRHDLQPDRVGRHQPGDYRQLAPTQRGAAPSGVPVPGPVLRVDLQHRVPARPVSHLGAWGFGYQPRP
jgi:hypothetical protein